MASEKVILGVDDGFFNTKIVQVGKSPRIVQSRARVGRSEQLALNGRVTDISEIEVDGVHYSAGAVNGDNIAFDGYPTSPLNRVIVHHALMSAGYGGHDVEIATGLPIRLYYRPGAVTEKNESLIDKKTQNIMAPASLVKAPNKADRGMATIVRHDVLPEGLAAWFDYIIQFDSDGRMVASDERRSESVAIIDIGGRTTDFAVIESQVVDMARSGSVNVGMLDVHKHVRGEIMNKYDVSELSDAVIDKAVDTGSIKLLGKQIDVSQMVHEAKAAVVRRISNESMRLLGQAATLDNIIFIGGGSMGLREMLEDWFPHQTVADEPVFANARGMAKYMRFVAK
ncbi:MULTISPECIES: ParM/StbA family protein [unclassified Thioalkalivibrio]|uniref:ParM/StbA family protein n=1 Tax=unclassified Thioalkalivibrio TaxID=2621013 RepID=UPI000361528A|nr:MULTISPECIES: ParM/StbA family protein [unclassified Thioalkalivibrio]